MKLPQSDLAELTPSGEWPSQTPHQSPSPIADSGRRRVRLFFLFAILVVSGFIRPIYTLINFAVHSDLYSHIILIPFISFYLIWSARDRLTLESKPSRLLALVPVAIVAGILAVGYLMRAHGGIQEVDYLALMTLAFVILLWAGCLFFFGFATLRAFIFPLLFLIFIVPFPNSLEHGLQSFLQLSSAAAAHLFFQISGTPVLRQGTVFQLPGFTFEVAPECSGIHSSLVLFITSFLTGHLLLRNLWPKALFVLFVIPLAIIRNGIRILIIGQLCVRVSPDMINSYIHRHGGPIFFAGSLVPFFLFVLLLMKLESMRRHTSTPKVGS